MAGGRIWGTLFFLFMVFAALSTAVSYTHLGDEANRLNPKDYKAMFELHIEQGPILEAAGNGIE